MSLVDQTSGFGPCIPQLGPNALGSLPSLLFLLGCVKTQEPTPKTPKKPHIVFMLVDDLGWNDVSFHGSKQIPTPNVDAMARDGIILNHYYVQTICSPSRATLMTGKYPIRTGFQHEVILADTPWGLALNETILPQYLKSLGYSIHGVGKWHLGYFKEAYVPTERDFDTFFGYYNGVEDYFTHFSNQGDLTGLDLHDNGKNVWEYNGTYGADLFTAKARKVILEHDPQKPLFLYFAQQAPHSGNFDNPLQSTEEYIKPLVGITYKPRRIFGGMVSSMDHSVGEIIEALDQSGMLDDTLFILSTDNGGAPIDAQGSRGSNWPLKGCKYTLWEGGVRGVSFVWSSALRSRSRIYNGLMHISDWLPTILSAVGGPEAVKMLPENTDGVDHWPSIANGAADSRSEILLNIDTYLNYYAIRRGRYKLVKGTYDNGTYDKYYDQQGRVFNVTYSYITPAQKVIYQQNYQRYLRRSKAAAILQKRYGRDPRLASSCTTLQCRKNLEVKCGIRPLQSNCDNTKEACLFDVIKDPCEFHNIAKRYPQIVSNLQSTVDKYRTVAVPAKGTPGNPPPDPAANPKLHNNTWVPYE